MHATIQAHGLDQILTQTTRIHYKNPENSATKEENLKMGETEGDESASD